jgi:hypothetical protein
MQVRFRSNEEGFLDRRGGHAPRDRDPRKSFGEIEVEFVPYLELGPLLDSLR